MALAICLPTGTCGPRGASQGGGGRRRKLPARKKARRNLFRQFSPPRPPPYTVAGGNGDCGWPPRHSEFRPNVEWSSRQIMAAPLPLPSPTPHLPRSALCCSSSNPPFSPLPSSLRIHSIPSASRPHPTRWPVSGQIFAIFSGAH
jgi:hypothetical protein